MPTYMENTMKTLAQLQRERDRAIEKETDKAFVCWIKGNAIQLYGIYAKNRNEAREQFARLAEMETLKFVKARRCKPEGEYCLMPSGAYGIFHG